MADMQDSRSAEAPTLRLVRTTDEIREDRPVIRFNLAAAQAAEGRAENDAAPQPGDTELIAALDGWRDQEWDRHYWQAARDAEIPDVTVLVEDALRSLGDTPDKVAATLTAKSITGERDNAAGSPVAEFLYRQKLGFDEVEVDGHLVRIGRVRHPRGAYDPNPARLPAAVAEFESRFDAGFYPHLVKGALAVAA